MEKDTNGAAHKGTGLGTGIFFTNVDMGKGIIIPYP